MLHSQQRSLQNIDAGALAPVLPRSPSPVSTTAPTHLPVHFLSESTRSTFLPRSSPAGMNALVSSRVQLAAALLDYDEEQGEFPTRRAQVSAVLGPFRDVLERATAGLAPPSDHSDAGTEEDDTEAVEEAPAQLRDEDTFGGRGEMATKARYRKSLTGSQLEYELDVQLEEEQRRREAVEAQGEEARLVDEYGLGEYLLPARGTETALETAEGSGGTEGLGITGERTRYTFPSTADRNDDRAALAPPTTTDDLTPYVRTRNTSQLSDVSGRRNSLSISAILSQPSDPDRPSSRLSLSNPLDAIPYDEEEAASPYNNDHPAFFTSRFDPVMLSYARQEVQNDRPVFLNKDAGALPKIVMMPAPLSGQPWVPVPKPRMEGPESDSSEEEVEEVPRAVRAAGALYGRSLLDVLAERKAATKARQKGYIPGQDGRRSMMDWSGSAAAAQKLQAESAGMDVPVVGGRTAIDRVARSKSAMSIFGPDLIYQREMEKRVELEKQEALEKLVADRIQAEVEEKRRLKAEAKKGKNRKAAEMKLSGWQPEVDVVIKPVALTTPERPAHARKPSLAPSLTLPASFEAINHNTITASPSWFPPPSPASTTSSDGNIPWHRESARTQSPLRRPPIPGQAIKAEAAQKQSPQLRSPAQMWRSEAGSESSGMSPLASPVPTPARSSPRIDTSAKLSPPVLPSLDPASLVPLSHPIDDSSSDTSDDVPLGLRHPAVMDDDDIPLGFKQAQPFASTTDEDDRPLAFSNPSLALQQQQYQSQQAHDHQMMQQAEQMRQSMYIQSSMAMAEQQMRVGMMGSQVGGYGGEDGIFEVPSGAVERWRRGVSTIK